MIVHIKFFFYIGQSDLSLTHLLQDKLFMVVMSLNAFVLWTLLNILNGIPT